MQLAMAGMWVRAMDWEYFITARKSGRLSQLHTGFWKSWVELIQRRAKF